MFPKFKDRPDRWRNAHYLQTRSSISAARNAVGAHMFAPWARKSFSLCWFCLLFREFFPVRPHPTLTVPEWKQPCSCAYAPFQTLRPSGRSVIPAGALRSFPLLKFDWSSIVTCCTRIMDLPSASSSLATKPELLSILPLGMTPSPPSILCPNVSPSELGAQSWGKQPASPGGTRLLSQDQGTWQSLIFYVCPFQHETFWLDITPGEEDP